MHALRDERASTFSVSKGAEVHNNHSNLLEIFVPAAVSNGIDVRIPVGACHRNAWDAVPDTTGRRQIRSDWQADLSE